MHKILVLGKSGGGKSSSLRGLNPKETVIINSDKKALPLLHWRKNYVNVKKEDGVTSDLDKSNYIEVDSPNHILKTMKYMAKRKDIKVIVLDTVTHMITADYMNNTIGKDYQAYQNMGLNVYKLFDFIRTCPKTVIVMGHITENFNDMGQKQVIMKAHGKMISDMEAPSFFTTVLMTEIKMKDGERDYTFRTQSLGPDPAKSPASFDKDKVVTALPMNIPNDLQIVINALNKFEGI